ncbi:acyltransferase [Acidaminococcus fermentans]|uniref:acyltransferase n=1 Tax=Acidaminococcus fermentans TaxID=905 RepID=UPI00242F1870|nr:acyltransferase [Acidaminococcus fermentans]
MKQRNLVFDNLRGICMLGVIAIHVGSMAVTDAEASPFLVLITNILSRYSVPAFFFISGYGLFYSKPLEERLDYGAFLKKRLKSIGRPYLLASLFYLCYYAFLNRDMSVLDPSNILFSLFFGAAQYHIYFLVILIWFYLLFPLWRSLMRAMEKIGLKVALPLLFIAQLLLFEGNFHFWTYPQWIASSPALLNLCNYRLNYFPFFYLFIFMLGGVIARHYEGFKALITRQKALLTAFFAASAGCNTWLFYRWTFKWQMPYENTVNYLQQLSLPGLVYTIASILFFSMVLQSGRYPLKRALKSMSDRSFVIYLIHPVFIDQLENLLNRAVGIRQVPMEAFYMAVLLLSWGGAEIWYRFRAAKA